MWLKQSTAVEIKIGPFVDNTDGFTAETGLTLAQADVRLAKNGANWAQKNESTTMVHEENGNYRCLLDATDTDTLGLLVVSISESGALPVRQDYMVLEANIYDSLLGGGDLLDVNVPGDVGGNVVGNVGGSVASVTGNVGGSVASVTGNVGGDLVGSVQGSVLGSVASVVADVILADSSITSAKFDNDAITGAAIAPSAVTALRALLSSTADSGSTTTLVDTALAYPDTDQIKGCWILFTSGNLDGQVRLITAFNPATDTATFSPATTQAVSAHTYEILPAAAVDVALWVGAVVNALQSGRVDASVGAMAANVVTAAAIATNALDADAIAADAVTELQSGLATAAALATVDAAVAAVQTDTNDIQTRLPAALVSGRMDSSVGAMAASVLTAAAVAADYGAAVADYVLNRTYANARASSLGDARNKRSLLGAIAKAVNRVAISGATMTIYNEDDSTSTAPGGTQTLTTDAAADPIIEQDP